MEISSLIDHSVLHPTAGKKELEEGIQVALKYSVASLCVKPWMVPFAAQSLKDSKVKVCTVIGFPSGGQTTKTKVFETKEALEEGATEIDMVINISKALEGDWQYVQDEINQIKQLCARSSAILKVIFETDYIEKESDKQKLCQICSNLQVEFVKTSTGFGFVKDSSGKFSTTGATVSDIALFKRNISEGVQIKASGGVRSLEDLLKMKDAGAQRIGTSATDQIMKDLAKQ